VLSNFDLHLSQDEEEEEEQDETEVTSTLSDSDIHNPRKNRVVVRKYPFSHPFARLDPNYSWKTSQHAELRQADGGGSSTVIGGSDADPGDSHKRPREVLLHLTLLFPKAGLFRNLLIPKIRTIRTHLPMMMPQSRQIQLLLLKQGKHMITLIFNPLAWSQS
jgi:hypothetical protein